MTRATGRARVPPALFVARMLFLAIPITMPQAASGADAAYHHVHLNVPNPEDAVQWYIRNMGCQIRPGRKDACQFGDSVYLAFYTRPNTGVSDGTAVNHIGLSFASLTTKMRELEAAGVKVVTPMRDAPGLFKLAFVEDPWGTRIEVLEDPESLGFHHLHLRSRDADAALTWYRNVFGGQPAKLKGQLNGLRYGEIWLLVTPQTDGQIAPTEGRSIEHLGFSFPDLDAAAADLKRRGFPLSQEVRTLTNGPIAKNGFIVSPDGVRIELAQPLPAAVAAHAPAPAAFTPARTSWNHPDLQGMWTFEDEANTPFERPTQFGQRAWLTDQEFAEKQAQVRRAALDEKADRRVRPGDTGAGPEHWYEKGASRRTSIVVDPPDGRLPPLTPEGQKTRDTIRAERATRGPLDTWEGVSTYDRCLARVIPRLPSSYNSALQLLQTPDSVVLFQESMHDARVIPLDGRPHLGAGIRQWNGDSRGRWDGNVLVIDTTNFSDKQEFAAVPTGPSGRGTPQGNWRLVERLVPLDADTIEYSATVEDSTMWTRPWTLKLTWRKNAKYRIFEYACHEGNYSMSHMLSGARAEEQGGR